MSVLRRKAERELMSARGPIAGVLAVTAVGVACLVALASSFLNLSAAKERYYDRSNIADFWVDLRKAPSSVVERVERTPGVAEAAGRISFPARVDFKGVDEIVTARALSVDPTARRRLNDLVLSRGTWFGGESREEAIVDASFAAAHGLEPGDTIPVILEGRRQSLRVVGVATSAEFTYLIGPGAIAPDPLRYGLVWVPQRFAQEATDYEDAVNQVVGRLSPGADVDVVLERLERLLDAYGVIETTPLADQRSNWILSDDLRQLRITSIVLPCVFLAVAALVLNVMMGRLVERERTVIGTLKAIGYSDAQIRRHYLMFGVLIGLAGGALGCVGGVALGEGMIRMFREFYIFPSLDNALWPWVLALGLAVSVVFAVLGALRGARSATRLDPSEAMRPRPPRAGGRVWLERVGFVWRRLDFRWRMAVRNIHRQRTRTGAGLFAGAMGGALLFTTFALLDSFGQIIEFQYERVVNSDYDLILEEERSRDALLEARRLPGVATAEGLFVVAATLERGHREERTAITGVERGARLTVPRDASGAAVRVPERGLLLTRTLAEMLDVEAGETITVTPIRGDRVARTMAVHRITDSYLGLSAYADAEWLRSVMGESDSVSTLQVRIARSAGSEAAFIDAVRERPAIESATPNDAMKRNLEELILEQMTATLGVLIGFSGVLFLGSVISSALISMAERARELATLRVLGYSSEEVASLLYRESMMVHVAGALIGLPIGWLLLRSMASAYSTELYRIPLTIRGTTWLLAPACAIIFVGAAHLLVRRALRLSDWRDAINVKE